MKELCLGDPSLGHGVWKGPYQGPTLHRCKNIHIKDADSIINKYIITENTRVQRRKRPIHGDRK